MREKEGFYGKEQREVFERRRIITMRDRYEICILFKNLI